MKQAKSIEHIKQVGEFFPKGSMVRQSLCAVRPRKHRIRMRTDCDMWRVSAKGGHVYLADNPCDRSAFYLDHVTKVAITFTSYSHFVCNWNTSDSDWLANFNKVLARLNSGDAKCT